MPVGVMREVILEKQAEGSGENSKKYREVFQHSPFLCCPISSFVLMFFSVKIKGNIRNWPLPKSVLLFFPYVGVV